MKRLEAEWGASIDRKRDPLEEAEDGEGGGGGGKRIRVDEADMAL